MRNYFTMLLRYSAWANRRVLAALREQPTTQAEALPLFAHVLAAEHVWLSRLHGVPARVAVWPTLTLEQCSELAEENASGYESYIACLSDGDLGTRVRYRNQAGQEFETPIADILKHVATHGGYHRGQVAKAMARSGGKSVNTDYIIFIREVG
jgi:uncharacterized damage-inducible protein DinB